MPVFEKGNMDRLTNAEEHEVIKNGVENLSTELNNKVDSQNDKIDQALNQSQTALSGISEALDKSNQALSENIIQDASILQNSTDIQLINNDSGLNLRSIENSYNYSTVNIIGSRKNGGSQISALPVASSVNAGVLNVADYTGFKAYEPRIAALEGGSPPTPIEIGIWTIAKEGLIKGSSRDGELYPNVDGTGSVNGWDNVLNDISANKTAINVLQNGKVPKLTTPSPPPSGLLQYVYCQQINSSGVRTEIGQRTSASSVPNGIPIRDGNSNIPVPLIPINDVDATSKQYVDDSISGISGGGALYVTSPKTMFVKSETTLVEAETDIGDGIIIGCRRVAGSSTNRTFQIYLKNTLTGNANSLADGTIKRASALHTYTTSAPDMVNTASDNYMSIRSIGANTENILHSFTISSSSSNQELQYHDIEVTAQRNGTTGMPLNVKIKVKTETGTAGGSILVRSIRVV